MYRERERLHEIRSKKSGNQGESPKKKNFSEREWIKMTIKIVRRKRSNEAERAEGQVALWPSQSANPPVASNKIPRIIRKQAMETTSRPGIPPRAKTIYKRGDGSLKWSKGERTYHLLKGASNHERREEKFDRQIIAPIIISASHCLFLFFLSFARSTPPAHQSFFFF